MSEILHSSEPYDTRCYKCRMRESLCVCLAMPHFDLQTRVSVIMQSKEFSITTNTGHLIPKILKNSSLHFRGHWNKKPLQINDELSKSNYQPLVLFPAEDAQVLTSDFVKQLTKPAHLIVLDGNWRQASKMMKRVPELADLPKVILPNGGPSRYRLRISPRDDGVCTLEAISRALSFFEGDDVQRKIDTFFETMVSRVLWTRGKIRGTWQDIRHL